ncbi:MAG: hypothetical protein RL297_500 [Pseudomonadota bacterium]|jgi:GT2 family glycosyltransferase
METRHLSELINEYMQTKNNNMRENDLIQNQEPAQVSVIIVNWNAGDLLEKCISSLFLQTVLPDEIIVVDNFSTDNSIKIIADKFTSVRIIQLDKNIGFAAANNIAINDSSLSCRWVVFLNPDAFPDTQWLEALLRASRRHSEHTIFGSRLMVANNNNVVDGVGDVYHFSGLVWRSSHGMSLRPEDLLERDIFTPCAASAMFRKDILIAAGGFDEDYFCYVEDVDLGFRLRLMGHKCLFVPDSVAYHIGSAITGKRSDFSVYHGHRNLVWTYVKNMPGILFWLFFPFHLLLNLLSIIWFSVRGQGKVILRAKLDAISGLPKIWMKRKIIQSKRVVPIFDLLFWLDKTIIPIFRR